MLESDTWKQEENFKTNEDIYAYMYANYLGKQASRCYFIPYRVNQ